MGGFFIAYIISMSTFTTSTDKHPVYIDSLGNPLSYGKLYYYSIDTDPSQLKSVYADISRTIELDNPQILNAAGRTDTQVYLGEGDYTVRAYKFNGVDVNTADPSDWSIDNQWNESGLTTAGSSGLVGKIVDTIADLRLLSGTDGAMVSVLGYYNAGDVFVRNYYWDADDTASDNGGTIIKNPTIALGSWRYQSMSDVIDIRVFGVIPNRIQANNSAINTAITVTSPKTLYFPSGIYYVSAGNCTFSNKVIFEKGVRFFNNVSGGDPYTINVNGCFDFRMTTNIQYGTLADVELKFTSNTVTGTINPLWYNCVYSTTPGVNTDTTAAFLKMVRSVPTLNNYTIEITDRLYVNYAMNTIFINCNLLFTYRGQLHNGATNSSITFPAWINITNNTNNSQMYNQASGVRYKIFKGSERTFNFTGRTIYASWFCDSSYSTLDLNNIDNGNTDCTFIG